MTHQEGLASTLDGTSSGVHLRIRSKSVDSQRGPHIDDRPCRFRVPRCAGFRERRAAPFRVRAKRPPKSTERPAAATTKADGLECALRATRNAPRLPSSHESALPHPRTQTALRPRGDLASGKPLSSPMSGKGRKPWGRRSSKGKRTRKDESSKEGVVRPFDNAHGHCHPIQPKRARVTPHIASLSVETDNYPGAA